MDNKIKKEYFDSCLLAHKFALKNNGKVIEYLPAKYYVIY